MELYVNGNAHLEAAKKALKGACVKLPGTPTIKVIEHGTSHHHKFSKLDFLFLINSKNS